MKLKDLYLLKLGDLEHSTIYTISEYCRPGIEDLSVLSQWMNGIEKKQSNEMATYLSPGFHMDRTLTAYYCRV